MTIKIGDKLPEGTLSEFIETETEGCSLGPNTFKVEDLVKVPRHLPERKAERLIPNHACHLCLVPPASLRTAVFVAGTSHSAARLRVIR